MARAKGALESLVDEVMAFAADILQRLPLEDGHASAVIADYAGLLQSARHQVDGWTMHVQHASQEFLSQMKSVT